MIAASLMVWLNTVKGIAINASTYNSEFAEGYGFPFLVYLTHYSRVEQASKFLGWDFMGVVMNVICGWVLIAFFSWLVTPQKKSTTEN